VRESYTTSDVTMFFDENRDLQLFDSDGNNITVYHQGVTSSYAVEHVSFGDSTVWDLSSVEIETHGTSSGETLTGSDVGDASSADTMYGYRGERHDPRRKRNRRNLRRRR
jgi:hypothetical protein